MCHLHAITNHEACEHQLLQIAYLMSIFILAFKTNTV